MSLKFPTNPKDGDEFAPDDPARVWAYSSTKARWELISDSHVTFGADAPVTVDNTEVAGVTYGYDIKDLPNT